MAYREEIVVISKVHVHLESAAALKMYLSPRRSSYCDVSPENCGSSKVHVYLKVWIHSICT